MYSLGSQLLQPRIGDAGAASSWMDVVNSLITTGGQVVTSIVNKPKTSTLQLQQQAYDANAYAANTNVNTASMLPGTSNLPFGLTPTTLISGGVGILLLVKLMKKSGK